MKFIVIKKRKILFCILMLMLFFLIYLCSVLMVVNANVPQKSFTIVIDAGHGGVDVKLGQ